MTKDFAASFFSLSCLISHKNGLKFHQTKYGVNFIPREMFIFIQIASKIKILFYSSYTTISLSLFFCFLTFSFFLYVISLFLYFNIFSLYHSFLFFLSLPFSLSLCLSQSFCLYLSLADGLKQTLPT